MSDQRAELVRLRAGIKKAARDLYAIEVRRQSLGWHEELTKRLVVVQHNLSTLYNDQSDASPSHCHQCSIDHDTHNHAAHIDGGRAMDPNQQDDVRIVQEAIDLWRLRYDPRYEGPTMAEAIVAALHGEQLDGSLPGPSTVEGKAKLDQTSTGEDLGDSGMGQTSGLSDGPQC